VPVTARPPLSLIYILDYKDIHFTDTGTLPFFARITQACGRSRSCQCQCVTAHLLQVASLSVSERLACDSEAPLEGTHGHWQGTQGSLSSLRGEWGGTQSLRELEEAQVAQLERQVGHPSVPAMVGHAPSESGFLLLPLPLRLAPSPPRVLSAGSNALSGTVPAAISALTQLTFLTLDNNLFTGALPAELSSLTALHWQYVSSCPFLILKGPVT